MKQWDFTGFNGCLLIQGGIQKSAGETIKSFICSGHSEYIHFRIWNLCFNPGWTRGLLCAHREHGVLELCLPLWTLNSHPPCFDMDQITVPEHFLNDSF